MQKKSISFQIKGMRRDIAISKADPSYAYEIVNMRITPSEEGTMLSLVNEKGNSVILLCTYDGSTATPYTLSNCEYVGHCVINEFLVLFVRRDSVYSTIYRIDFNSAHTIGIDTYYEIKEIFNTHSYNPLGFDPAFPIETLGDYETENVIKVYFTDGVHQPRVINIKKDYAHNESYVIGGQEFYNSDELNFIRNLKIDQSNSVTITKKQSVGALFSSGTIQYFLTYFSLHGQESNIFYTSPLYYISDSTRGNAPDETSIGNAFDISISNLDKDFDFVRIYSLRRTSLDTTPIAKRVIDIPITSSASTIHFVDTNINGEEIDPTLLYYLGGEPISAETLEAKDNTLFLGNLSLLRQIPLSLGYEVDSSPIKTNADSVGISLPYNNSSSQPYKAIELTSGDPSVLNVTYAYNSQLEKGSNDVTVFKTNEIYRLGYQLQHSSGVWTDAYWINDKEVDVKPISSTTQTKFPVFKYTSTINSEAINALKALGYVAIRPLIVYPKFSDRKVLCQGMICPTVFNKKERADNTLYGQASWFARPMPYGNTLPENDNPFNGAWIEFRHNTMLHPSTTYGNEIQSMDAGAIGNNVTTTSIFTSDTLNSEYSDYYFVDDCLVTLNTPDLDFDESFMLREGSLYSFNVAGIIPIHTTTSDISILASAPFEGDSTEVISTKSPLTAKTIKLGAVNYKFSLTGSNGWKHSPMFPQWVDKKVYDLRKKRDGEDNDVYNYLVAGAYISPWHKTGQFIPAEKRSKILSTHTTYLDPQYEAGVLRQKKMSHMQFSWNTLFTSNVSAGNGDIAVSTFNSDEPTVSRIKVPEYTFGRYSGNIDKVLIHGTHNSGSYKINITSNKCFFKSRQGYIESVMTNLEDVEVYSYSNYDMMVFSTGGSGSQPSDTLSYDGNTLALSASDPISIKYKSTPHLVLCLGGTNSNYSGNKYLIPYLSGSVSPVNNDYSSSSTIPFPSTEGASALMSSVGGYLILGEIWNNNVSNRFGGTTKEALISNDWIVGGDSVPLESGFTLVWDRGDSYYQRYDCLKTYPYTLEDENSIVEIVSFMCETRVNIDGRYDKNRGTASLVAHPTNFNLLNPVYSQKDNFFTYRGFNSLNQETAFPNQITWTLTKYPNAEVDNWTNVTLASTLNLDGDKGKINKLVKFRNDIYSFQEKGISRILFNDRTVLNTTSGLPVQLANSGRVEGKIYFTESQGLTNKVSIKVTPNGVYFIDGNTMSACIFTGEQCISLSDQKAMKTFFAQKSDNFNIFYDSRNKDVYFVNDNTCLCFSETFSEFVGLFNYENTPMMDVVNDKFISLYDSKLWLQNSGDYNNLYNTVRPFSVTFVGNDVNIGDKIFTNIDWIADSCLDDTFVTTKTFDRLKVWNEYQSGESALVNTSGHPSNLKKKFRIWHTNIPRAKWNGRDRIRNPWCFVQLKMNNPGRYKTILQNTYLNYYV